MEKTKLLTIAVLGLLILNFILLSFLWFGTGQERAPQERLAGGRGQAKALEFLMNELHFDVQQRAICDSRLLKHRFLMDSLQNAHRMTHDRLFANLKIGDTSGVFLLGEIQRQNEIEVFSYFYAIRAVCKDDQKTHFDRILYDAMRMLKPRR
jgi:periplasmic protein CpxP/Spy